MPDRHFPVRPNLDQLKHQAKDLLRGIKHGDPAATAELLKHHPEKVEPSDAKLADAQLTLARSYGLPNWTRLANQPVSLTFDGAEAVIRSGNDTPT